MLGVDVAAAADACAVVDTKFASTDGAAADDENNEN